MQGCFMQFLHLIFVKKLQGALPPDPNWGHCPLDPPLGTFCGPQAPTFQLTFPFLIPMPVVTGLCDSLVVNIVEQGVPSFPLPPVWPSGKVSTMRVGDMGFEPHVPVPVIPVTSDLLLKWLPCQAPGMIGSVLGLVGMVSLHWLGEMATLTWDLYLSVTVHRGFPTRMVYLYYIFHAWDTPFWLGTLDINSQTDQSPRYSVAMIWSNQETNEHCFSFTTFSTKVIHCDLFVSTIQEDTSCI